MKTEDFKEIIYDKGADGIVTVTLNIPKRKNAMSRYTFYELFWAVDALEKDDGAHVMILTGAKDPAIADPAKEAFSSGGYFHPSAMAGVSEEVVKQIDPNDIAQAKLTLKMWQCQKPIIGAMNGLAIGAGFTMLFSGCDLIYCSEHAWARLPFVKLGIVPELACTLLLPRLIGFQRANEIMLLGDPIPAKRLAELGIANRVLPHDQLLPYAREVASKLAPPQGASSAVRLTKRAMHRPLVEAVTAALEQENQSLREAFKSADFQEALAAGKEKRNPSFKGR